MIITKTIIFGSPAIAKTPSTERIHKRRSTDAPAWNVRGRMLIAHPMTSKISTSHKVTA